MAEEKKSVIVYVDWGTTFDSLEDDEAGRLIKHFFNYVRDLNPTPPDKLTQIAFEPIKQQLKRDLQSWLIIKEKRSLAGKASANKREQNSTNPTHVESVKQASTNPTVNDNVNVTVNVNDTVIKKEEKEAVASPPKKNILERSEDFGKNLEFYKNEYSRELLKDFYNYWKEPNQTKTKMRFELEKTWDLNLRLKRWAKGDDKFGNKTQPPQPETPRYNIYEQIKKYG